MEVLTTFLRGEVEVLLVVSILLIVYQILNRTINLDGLLDDKFNDRTASPERVQLLVATFAGAGYLLLSAFNARLHPGQFPALPKELLLALGGSNVLYLGGKATSLIAAIRSSFGSGQ